MNSLQIGLAVLGLSLLAVLFVHAAWLSRRASRVSQSGRIAAPMLEPRLDLDGEAPVVPEPDAAPAQAAPEPALPMTVLSAAVSGRRHHPSSPRLDPLIDAIAILQLDAALNGSEVIAHLPASRRAGSKPFLIEGNNAATRQWEMLQPTEAYRELRAGVQMANRHGALNEIEYSEFVQKIQTFADAVGAATDFPDMLVVVARGRELDAFAGHLDAQLIMRLKSSQMPSWPVALVQAQAARHGFQPGSTPGRMVMPSREEGAPPVLSLQFDPQAAMSDDPRQAVISEFALSFDVPQTAESEQPFNAWRAAGHALSLALEARVADDEGQPLPLEVLSQVEKELRQLYIHLHDHGLAAGAPATRRMFS
jgi:hypothetical protein